MTAPSQADEFPLPSGPAWTQPGEWPLVAPCACGCSVDAKPGNRYIQGHNLMPYIYPWNNPAATRPERVLCVAGGCPVATIHPSQRCAYHRDAVPPAQPRRTEGLL